MPLNESLEPRSIYIALDARPEKDEYHWGLIITDGNAATTGHHVTNRAGPWVYEEKHDDLGRSLTLIALIRVSGVANNATQIIKDAPASGKPSERTGEAFTCRTWVKDTLVSLHESGAILLPTDIDTIERQAKRMGGKLAPICERGESATVVEDTIFSQIERKKHQYTTFQERLASGSTSGRQIEERVSLQLHDNDGVQDDSS